jgi:hypothetical protein
MDLGPRVKPREEGDVVDVKFDYPAFVGKVLYLSLCSHLDIFYVVWELAQFISNFGTPHIATAKHLLCYLQGCSHTGLSSDTRITHFLYFV